MHDLLAPPYYVVFGSLLGPVSSMWLARSVPAAAPRTTVT
jgi:hypothetical protein